ncbi:MAG: hypothetical protein K9G62_01475 [Alphaproteobacteria bacterium]|nr:hypothetical protein [Alphaproteobacteria bacterium]
MGTLGISKEFGQAAALAQTDPKDPEIIFEGGLTYTLNGETFTKSGVPVIIPAGANKRILGPGEEFSAAAPIDRLNKADKESYDVGLLTKGSGPLKKTEEFKVDGGNTIFILPGEKDKTGEITLPPGTKVLQKDGRLEIDGGVITLTEKADLLQIVMVGDGKAVMLPIDVDLLKTETVKTTVGKDTKSKDPRDVHTPTLAMTAEFEGQYKVLKDKYGMADADIVTLAEEARQAATYQAYPGEKGFFREAGDLFNKGAEEAAKLNLPSLKVPGGH